MRRTTVVTVAVAALLGAGAGAAVTAYDGADLHHPMTFSGPAGAGADHMDGRFGGRSGTGHGMGFGMGFGMGYGSGHLMGHGMGHGMGQHVTVTSEHEFLVEMVAHHQEAIRAARELARSDRATMRAFGERIVEAQSAQVVQMQAWLDEWYGDDSPDADYDPMMRDLSGLSGDRLDRTFLEDMVWHHMAAVMMSQHLLVSGLVEHDEVAALARDIRDEQRAEIVQMRRWLADWSL
ncbi:DUF305 domain-containing protein [Nocardioides cavernae]|uniref:DUF305 domain-containing protein n=1 Tax=Nocardioides TaxID=1839 RepID=UPI000A75DF5D|nr:MULTISPECIES: DUF305 domain-containing protein [Nocardioides]MCK9823610.1 DUF305 domain-containing protein [Nocardioides cavernae]